MANRVAIYNYIASLIGEDSRIVSPEDDKLVARSISAVWDMMRQAAIRDHSWNCMMARATLPSEALDAVPYPWAYSFRLPARCLRLIEVLDDGAREDYQLEGRSILTNLAGPLHIRYLNDVEETDLWDSLFTDAFAKRVAVEIGTKIAGSSYSQQAGWELYQQALATAKRKDALENPPIEDEATGWELARYGYSSAPGVGGW